MDGNINRRKYYKTSSCSRSESGRSKDEQNFHEAWYRNEALQQTIASESTQVPPVVPLDLINKRSYTIQTPRQVISQNNNTEKNIIEDKIIKHKLPEVCIPPKNHNSNPARNFYEPISPPSPEAIIYSDVNEQPVQHEIHILTEPEYQEYLMYKEYYEKSNKEDERKKENSRNDAPDAHKLGFRQQQIEEVIGLSDGYKEFLFSIMNIIITILEIPKKKKYHNGVLSQLSTRRRKSMLTVIKHMSAMFLMNESTMEILEMFMNDNMQERVHDLLIKEFSLYKDPEVINIDEEVTKIRNMQENASNPQTTTNQPRNVQQTSNESRKDSMDAETEREWQQARDMYMNIETVYQESNNENHSESTRNNRQSVHTYVPHRIRSQNLPYDPQYRTHAATNSQTMPNDATDRTQGPKPNARRQMQPSTPANWPPTTNSSTSRHVRFPQAAVLTNRPMQPPEQFYMGSHYPLYNNQNQHTTMSSAQSYLNMPYL